MAPALRISNGEYLGRRKKIFETLADKDVSAVVVFSPTNVSYFSRFAFVPTERPMWFVFTPNHAALFVPRLEEEHAHEFVLADEVFSYPEYPDLTPPLEMLKSYLIEKGLGSANIAVDSDGYGRLYGYRGPSVSSLVPDAKVISIMDEIEYMQMINTEEELALIRESARWGNLAHALLQDYCEVGVPETEISNRASIDASRIMLQALGPEYRAHGWGRSGAFAGFRGQIGKESALPHALSNNARLQAGDVLVTGAGAPVWGYDSELERTMIMGEPNEKQVTYFNHMFNLQTIALDAIKPGITCADVDKEVRRYFEDNNLMENWRHHTGHAKSMLIHEAPFLDHGDNRVIEVGMVFTVEPGVYVPDFAGFRHSDTVAVTETGIEFLTYYPRDLESMIIPL
ncbi:MAG: aminopeptidase P family protein [Thermomicrobiales bacterium]|nr:aminopeptidase P family protein [Thermomicrobiales bacterium]